MNKTPHKEPRPPTAAKSDGISRSRRRLFSVIVFIVPVAVLFLLEVGLRMFHYGHDLSLFTTEEIGGKPYHIMNPDVKGRYFSRVEFSPNTSMDYFLVPKPKGTYRIFCLGGSTTVGYPYGYVGAFSTFLRDRLRRTFPDKSVEVINLGITATNSFTVVDIAGELVGYEPDFVIVYDGHNEFYGALGISSHETFGGYRWLTKLHLKLVQFRTYVFLRDVLSGIAGIFRGPRDKDPEGTMMERLARGQYVPFGSKTYFDCLSIFRANLDELKSICTSRHIPLVIATQVSNLRDLPPFESGEFPGKTPEERSGFKSTFERGIGQLKNAHADSAYLEFHQLLKADSMRADVHFYIARCLDSLGRKQESREEYRRARDYDRLRFRTSTSFNTAIREAEDDSASVYCSDMERVFEENSPDSIVGKELILEHLHPNELGYFLMAKEYAHTMRNRALLASREEWGKRDTVSDSDLWEERPVTVLDELCAQRRTEILTSAWPFTSGAQTLLPIRNGGVLNGIVEVVVKGRMTWEEGHVAAAEYYTSRNDFESAEKQYLSLINQLPVNVSGYLIVSQLYIRQGKRQNACDILLKSLNVEKTLFAYRTLGSIALNDGRTVEATSYLQHALSLSSSPREQSEVGYALALAYVRAGEIDTAVEQLHKVLEINPRLQEAQDLLGQLVRASQKK